MLCSVQIIPPSLENPKTEKEEKAEEDPDSMEEDDCRDLHLKQQGSSEFCFMNQ